MGAEEKMKANYSINMFFVFSCLIFLSEKSESVDGECVFIFCVVVLVYFVVQ